MNSSLWIKPLILFLVISGVVVSTFSFAVLHHDDGDNRVAFSLSDQHGKQTTQKDLAGRYQLVFFGFTSCPDICPTQMVKLSRLMKALDETGHSQRVTPVFISVDPERDNPQQIADYLLNFDQRFIGLTGSRTALKRTADSFKTYLQASPDSTQKNAQITHSSIVYVVDPFGRIIDYVPFNEGYESMVKRVRNII